MATPVIFKKFEGEITAVFPAMAATVGEPWHMNCYAHIGQHGAASVEWVRKAKPVKPHEYAALLSELKSIGYDDLVIRHRMTRADYLERKRAA